MAVQRRAVQTAPLQNKLRRLGANKSVVTNLQDCQQDYGMSAD